MAKPPIRIKRSAVSGAIPTTAQLALGELAINTADGKVFLKKDDGVESIVEVGAGGGGSYTSPSALALYEKNNSGNPDSFDGVETRFQLRDATGNPVTIASALLVAISVNGVVQKPNTGTPSSPFEGFYITNNASAGYDIVFDTAPPSGSDFFGVLAGTFTATAGTSGIKVLDDISSQFNGTLTDFTLQYNAANYTTEFPDALIISLGGVVQIPNDAYSISGSTISFTAAPPTGTSFYALSFEIGQAVDGVTEVTATTPLSSTGGTTPIISIQDGTTTQKGAVQLEDSTSSTSTTTAATPNSVKTAYDLADAALPVAGGALTGALGVISGSASAPSIYFDANTGIYSPGADQLALSTGGSGRLFVNSAGVITTDSDFTSNRFNVVNSNTVSTYDRMLFLRSNSLSNAWLGLGYDSFYIASATAAPIVFCTNSDGGASGTSVPTNERLRITSDGKVGIGTSSVQAPLHVLGAATVSSVGDVSAKLGRTGDSAVLIGSTDGNKPFIASEGAYPLYLRTNNQNALVVDSSQRVGIGTATPGDYYADADNLVVASSGATGITLASSTTQYGYICFADGTTGSDPYRGYIEYAHQTDHLAFATAGIQRLLIDSSGRLLVGTSSTSASTRLVVEGNSGGGVQPGLITLAMSGNTLSDGSALGALLFSDNSHTQAASITARRDGGTWTSGSSQPSRLVFSTTADGASSPTERMRIKSNGDTGLFGILDALWIASSEAAGTTNNLIIGKHSASGVFTGTTSFVVRTNGNVLNTNNSYGSLSDIKLKENIVDATSQWSDIKALQVRKYNFKEGQTHTQIGLIAQEVELVSPGLVSESPDRDEDGNDLGTVTKSVNYSVLYMKAVKALQEAMERIETLETKVAALESA